MTSEQQAAYETIYRTSGITDHPATYLQILRRAPAPPPGRWLDLACGAGRFLQLLDARGYQTVGADISSTALSHARQTAPAAALCHADIERLPFRDAAFDVVSCLGSFENVERPDAALAEARRVLTPAGRLYAVMPNRYWLGDILSAWASGRETPPFQRIERIATLESWRRWLISHGFEPIAVRKFHRYTPLIVGGKLRSLRKFLVRRLLNACTPTSLAWSLLFVCRPAPPARQPHWMWRAESSDGATHADA